MSEEKNQSAEDKANFQIQRLYVKAQSCKVPQAPQIFFQKWDKWEPEFTTELQINNLPLQKDHYDVTLQVTVTAKLKGVTVYVAEATQAGIFQLNGFDEDTLKQLLSGYCPNVLFPYLRKVIADMSLDAGFPPFTLAPINFEAAYQEQLREMAKETENEKSELVEETTH